MIQRHDVSKQAFASLRMHPSRMGEVAQCTAEDIQAVVKLLEDSPQGQAYRDRYNGAHPQHPTAHSQPTANNATSGSARSALRFKLFIFKGMFNVRI